MATGRNYLNKPTYRFINTVERDTKNPFTDQPMFEFDETHLWNSSNHMIPSSPKKSSIIPNSRITTTKKSSSKNNGDHHHHHHRTSGTATSLPMNIPDWSKILRDDRSRVNRKSEFDDYVDEEDEDERIPPHEFLARQLGKTQIASFSVHEGIGRTLKGRDLSRVRDAIWQQTGFED